MKLSSKMNPANASTFVAALAKARNAHKAIGENAHKQMEPLSETEAVKIIADGGTLLLTNDGMMGGFVKADGYMGGIFSHPQSGGGAVKSFMAEMPRFGGTYGSSFATLEGLYVRFGWEPVARVDFEATRMPEGSAFASKPDGVFYRFTASKKFTTGGGVRVAGPDARKTAAGFAKIGFSFTTL